MLAWHVPLPGRQRLPADLSEVAIAHFLTLRRVVMRAVRSRYTTPFEPGPRPHGTCLETS